MMAEMARRWPQGNASPAPALRWGLVALAIVAAGAVCAWAQIGENKDHQVAFLTSASTIAGTALGIFGWLVVTAPWSWGGRLRTLAAFGGLVGIGMLLVRIDETSGDVVPKLAWRWTPKHDVALAGEFADLVGGTADLSTTTPDDSPQFLGKDRSGRVSEPRLSRDWSSHPPRELWRRPIGAAWSSFAIVGNYAVTQEQRGENELVVCYELATGKPVWYHADKTRFEEVLAGVGPRSTPTIDEGRVYTMGARGLLNCLDGATGKRLWSHDVAKENGADTPELQPQWGKSCSPLIVDDAVVVSAGGPDGHSLVAYDKRTGDELWHAGSAASSYSSPLLATLAGRRQIVIINRPNVAGHDPADGRILWTFDWPEPNPKCAEPLVTGDDTVLVSAGYGIGSALLRIVPGSDGIFTAEQLWADRNLRNLKSKFADMVLLDNFVYALDDGVLCCVEAETGKRRWRGGRYQHGQLLLVGDLLLVQGEAGELALVDPQPKSFVELGRITALTAKTWNNPAISGNKLLVRNHEEAVCYELPLADAAEPSAEK
ncbi:MAG TPA: PQQ-binding-like beta-propeller repeat protein [Pirellulales bacterium]|nr:PQQ-binding-like beta-propeller repeat protein [Pirellulales bacterium]